MNSIEEKKRLEKKLMKAVNVLKKGGIIAYPTESSYAIGCLIDNVKGIKKIYSIKKRSKTKALPIISASKEMIERYAFLEEKTEKLIHNFMPGRLTLVVEKKGNVPKELSKKDIAFRIPENAIARKLCLLTGKPIIATSANISGKETIFSEKKLEKELKGKVDFILNAGNLPKAPASTIFYVKENKILRKGPVIKEEIEKVLEKKFISSRNSNIICLGIESTAHTFACGIVDENCKVLAHEKDSFKTIEGGLIPAQLAEHHFNCATGVIKKALKKACMKLKDIDLICFSQGPGIGNALHVGAITARTLALKQNIPLLGVNHCIAHIEIGIAKTCAIDPITVYASGANTQIIGFEHGKYRIFGETLDIGIGNLLDNFGRTIGIGFPAGPVLDQWYFEANADNYTEKNFIELPYSVKGSDLVFSGLLTAAEQKIGKVNERNLVYSLLHTAFAMLTEVTERALAHSEKKEVLLVGGVAASKALRKMLSKMCKERNAKLFVPDPEYCVDNAIMIAWQGLLEYKNGKRMTLKESGIKPKQRIEEIKVNWKKHNF